MATVEDHVTTALDTIALLAVSIGTLAGLWPYIHGWAIACGGVAVWFGVRVVDGAVSRWVDKFRRSP